MPEKKIIAFEKSTALSLLFNKSAIKNDRVSKLAVSVLYILPLINLSHDIISSYNYRNWLGPIHDLIVAHNV